jgi:hypothetical protein
MLTSKDLVVGFFTKTLANRSFCRVSSLRLSVSYLRKVGGFQEWNTTLSNLSSIDYFFDFAKRLPAWTP